MAEVCYGYSEDGYQDYIACAEQSWSWSKLTSLEQAHIHRLFYLARPEATTTLDYDAAFDKACGIYTTCLSLLGYNNLNWRDKTDNKTDNKNKVLKTL